MSIRACLSSKAWTCLQSVLRPAASEPEPELEPTFIQCLILLLHPNPLSACLCVGVGPRLNLSTSQSLQQFVMFHHLNWLLFLCLACTSPPLSLNSPLEPAFLRPAPPSYLETCWISVMNTLLPSLAAPFSLVFLLLSRQTQSWPLRQITWPHHQLLIQSPSLSKCTERVSDRLSVTELLLIITGTWTWLLPAWLSESGSQSKYLKSPPHRWH